MSRRGLSQELDNFQSAIALRLGLRFDDSRSNFLLEVLARRAAARHQTTRSYLAALQSETEPSDEISELARELTVGETYFFRHVDQFNALMEVALPERLSARAGSRSLRLLSAGCASGEEAYSLAILMRERGVEPGYQVTIQGLDINPDALARATQGLYSPWSLRETPPHLIERWFTKEGRDFRLAHGLRDTVQFHQHNLIASSARLLPAHSFDVVLCRNVLMYFTPEHASSIVENLARALAPGGFLFLGHAETMRGLSHAFHLRNTHDTFYYQRRSSDECDDESTRFEAAASAMRKRSEPPEAVARSKGWVDTWLKAVERSSDRIRELSENTTAALPATAPRPALRSSSNLSQPLELLRDERFGEALQVLQQLWPSGSSDPAAMLLRAALLTHHGQLIEAEKCCHELLRLDDLNAGAHYLLALCLERQGQTGNAIEHDLTAVYLDAGFAMPHLHLGLMARRRGDVAAARHELGQALLLLEREDASRLLLFGGGFGRGALVALCRSELANLTRTT